MLEPRTIPIPVARPEHDDREADAVRRVLASGWWTQGPEVDAFEREFAAYVGATHACAVSSGTAALHLALLVAGIEAGDEVITVSHSFVATASAIRYCGAKPVFVDIESATFNIDPRRVEAAISARTRAIVCVHQIGMPCDLAALIPMARRYDLALIEDAACAAGQRDLHGRPVGKDRAAPWRPGVFFLSPAQGAQHRRWRHDHDRQCRVGRAPAPLASARDGRAGSRAARCVRGHDRGVPARSDTTIVSPTFRLRSAASSSPSFRTSCAAAAPLRRRYDEMLRDLTR